MGWTYLNLVRNGETLQSAKENHVWQATRYCNGVTAELIANEWHPHSWYAIIRLTFPEDHECYHMSPKTFLRTDHINTEGGDFGYKDMDEGMGPYMDDAPSAAFKKLIYQHIPKVERCAASFRDKHGIKYDKPDLFSSAA